MGASGGDGAASPQGIRLPKGSSALRTVLTLALSLAGGLLALAAHLPAGLLVGGAFLVSVAAVAGAPALVPGPVRNTAFVLIGMTLGTNVGHDTLSLIGQWPVTLIGLVVELGLIIAVTGLMLNRVFGIDRSTAYLSAFPGHLSFVLGVAAAGYGDPRQVVLIQTIRVMMLTLLVPLVARVMSMHDLVATSNTAPLELVPLIGLIAACVAGGFAFTALRVPAGFVLGSMAVATIGKLVGLYDGAMPWQLSSVSYIIMGALIGSRFAGVRPQELRRGALGGLAATLSAVLIVTGVAATLALLVDMPFGQIWLGLAPGGLEAMGALGIALGYDTAFIAAHHTMRFIVLSFAIPLIARLAQEDRG